MNFFIPSAPGLSFIPFKVPHSSLLGLMVKHESSDLIATIYQPDQTWKLEVGSCTTTYNDVKSLMADLVKKLTCPWEHWHAILEKEFGKEYSLVPDSQSENDTHQMWSQSYGPITMQVVYKNRETICICRYKTEYCLVKKTVPLYDDFEYNDMFELLQCVRNAVRTLNDCTPT